MRFRSVRFDQQSMDHAEKITEGFEILERMIETALPENGRAKSIVMTHLEDAAMWVNKGLRDVQKARLTPPA